MSHPLLIFIQIHIRNGNQCRRQLIWIYTVCKGRAYPRSAGLGLFKINSEVCTSETFNFVWLRKFCTSWWWIPNCLNRFQNANWQQRKKHKKKQGLRKPYIGAHVHQWIQIQPTSFRQLFIFGVKSFKQINVRPRPPDFFIRQCS